MNNRWFGIGALFAGLSVILGAFGAHGLKGVLSPGAMETWQTAVRYMMFHSTALLLASFAMAQFPELAPLKKACWAFSIGIVLFSGSLFLLALTGTRPLGAITPVGGLFQIAGWVFLALAALKHTPKEG